MVARVATITLTTVKSPFYLCEVMIWHRSRRRNRLPNVVVMDASSFAIANLMAKNRAYVSIFPVIEASRIVASITYTTTWKSILTFL